MKIQKDDTEHKDYTFNEAEDLRHISEALKDINQRISEFEEAQSAESDEQEENDTPLWPSISNRTNQ